jgi:hypothetical protein
LVVKLTITALNTVLLGMRRWLPSSVISTVARLVRRTTRPSHESIFTWSLARNGWRIESISDEM